MKSILDPAFRYTNSASTDISKTFARVRRAQRDASRIAEAAQRAADADKEHQHAIDAENTRRVLVKFDERRAKGASK